MIFEYVRVTGWNIMEDNSDNYKKKIKNMKKAILFL